MNFHGLTSMYSLVIGVTINGFRILWVCVPVHQEPDPIIKSVSTIMYRWKYLEKLKIFGSVAWWQLRDMRSEYGIPSSGAQQLEGSHVQLPLYLWVLGQTTLFSYSQFPLC